MSSAQDPPGLGEHEQRPDRLIALSDGIFAIAMTLLVLDVSVPDGLDRAGFARSLRQAWPHLGAYALSFAIIAAVWRDHRRIFHLVRRADARVTRLNLVLLGVAALLPFPTALLADYGGSEPVAVTLYAATVAAINLLLLVLFLTVRRDEKLRSRPVEGRAAQGTIADFAATVLIAAASIAIAFAVSAEAGLLTWLAALPAGVAAKVWQRRGRR
ncbi:DUF1211 domain-containing protein [Actinospica durhamensis]|uniref:DUF1211 domain-containing protein n=1 Tax=Actinospica durhamensis TaxID=1508375 RepID=A0A941ENR5_9ACTN|nr:TMEM175 family protein [Actinospica durhamensis]MBR7834426.1 DUF1211 domain-containing protein [Actinospica durhamensis]